MTREHLIDDIRNVIAMVNEVENGEGSDDRVRRAIHGLYRHIEAEGDVPDRVTHCLEESLRALDRVQQPEDRDGWRYARTCLESALEFAAAESSVAS